MYLSNKHHTPLIFSSLLLPGSVFFFSPLLDGIRIETWGAMEIENRDEGFGYKRYHSDTAFGGIKGRVRQQPRGDPT